MAQHNASVLERELTDNVADLPEGRGLSMLVAQAPATMEARLGVTDALALTEAPIVSNEEPPITLDELQPRSKSNVIPEHRVAVLGEVGLTIAAFFRGSSYQSVIAFVVGTVGLLSIIDAPRFTQFVAVGAAAITVGVLANNESSQAWKGGSSDIETWVVGVEASAITVLAAYFGFEGFQLIMGACLALGLAHVASCWSTICAWMPQVSFFWFPLSAILGASMMKLGQQVACAVIGPMMGGLMVASSLVFLSFRLVDSTADAPPCWIDFADALLSGGGGAPWSGGEEELTITCRVGFAIWLLVAVGGLSRYFVGMPKMASVDPYTTRGSATASLPLSSGRSEPLLPRSVVAPAPAPAISSPARPAPQAPPSVGSRPPAPPAPPPFKFRGGGR